jgi:hypothetical protein
VPHLGTFFSKESSINEFAWALQPLAAAVTSQPIHQNSLFGIVEKLIPDSPEGLVWMAVYDLKTLMQLLEFNSSHLLFYAVFVHMGIDHDFGGTGHVTFHDKASAFICKTLMGHRPRITWA